MFVQLTAVAVDADPANLEELSAFLSEHNVQIVARLRSIDALEQLLAAGQTPHVVLINLDPSPSATLQRAAPLLRQYPQVNFFVMAEAPDTRLLMDAIHLGVREFVPVPIDEQKFRVGLERISRTLEPAQRGRIINVIPAAGGCGATTVACNVATALAAKGQAVLVDMDLVGGTIASSFDLRPRFTIADVMSSGDRLDQQLIENALLRHGPTGLAILARPELPEEAERVTPPQMGRLVHTLSSAFRYIIFDSSIGFDPLHLLVARSSDLNVLVLELNVPAIRNAERYIRTLERSGIDKDRIRVVANRFQKRRSELDVAQAEAEQRLGMKIAWTLPNDFKNAIAAANLGEPVVIRAPRSEFGGSLTRLASSLNGIDH